MTEDHIGRQWRACGQDHGHMDVEDCAWTTEQDARNYFEALLDADPAFDDVWLETREVLYTAPKRVTPVASPKERTR